MKTLLLHYTSALLTLPVGCHVFKGNFKCFRYFSHFSGYFESGSPQYQGSQVGALTEEILEFFIFSKIFKIHHFYFFWHTWCSKILVFRCLNMIFLKNLLSFHSNNNSSLNSMHFEKFFQKSRIFLIFWYQNSVILTFINWAKFSYPGWNFIRLY